MHNKNNKLELVSQIVRDSRKRKNIPSLLSFVLISLFASLTILIFANVMLRSDKNEPVNVIFRPSVAGDVIIRTIPTECSGWENPELAKSIDLLGSSSTKDFNVKNSASYTNNPYENLGEVAEFELANAKLVCGGFQLSENIPPEATDIVGTINFSFASDTFEGNEDIVVFAYTMDGGQNWKSIDSFALLEEMNNQTKEGYWSYPITDLNKLNESKDFLVRVQYVSEPNEEPATAYVDGIALDIKYFEDRKPAEATFLDPAIDVPADELPEFRLEVEHDSKFAFLGVDPVERTIEKVTVETPDDQVLIGEVETELNQAGVSTIATVQLTDENFTTPGIYTVTVQVKEDGVVTEIVEQFAWGVLVLNFDKSTYLPDETPLVGMGALDNMGNTLCNADLTLSVTSPSGQKIILKTTDGSIALSKECGPDTVTMLPDYSTTFPLPETGEYTLNLSAITDAGFYEINDTLTVQNEIPFSVTRRAPTRIWPMADYEVFLDVVPQEDYFGTVEEFIPDNFEIVSIDQDGEAQPIRNGRLPIQWHVDWNAGESYTLSYKINPPDISPELFLLGPASWPDYTVAVSEDPLAIAPGWTELRQWQIASDAVGAAFATRLFTSGFERNSVTANHEFTGTSGTAPTISTSTIRSGTYSLQTTASSATSGGYFDYAAADTGTARATYRAYLRVASLPSADTIIMGFYDGAALGTAQVSIHLDNSGNLKLCNDEDDATCSSPIGTASSAVTTNTWYRIELAYDFGTAATGDSAAYAQIDGNIFASSTTINHANGTRRIVFGTYSSSISADMYWDDLGLNADAFVGQQNWVGEGKVVLLLPDGNGTSSTWAVGTNAFDYLEVDDPPSTGFDDATTYVECLLTTDVDDYNLQSTASVGINANDRIRLVEGWSRARSTTATQSESSVSIYNGSTAEVGTRNGIASASWWTNDDTVPRANSVVIYNDVGTASHTPITPSDIDAYNLRLTTADCTPAHQVTAVWALVEYVPAEGGRLYSSGFELNSLTSGVEWDTVSGTLNIDGTTKRSGDYALRVQSLASGTEESVTQTIASANDTGAFFLRTYLNVATKPATNTENRIAEIKDSGGTARAYLTLRADASDNLTLRLYEDDGTAAQIGSDSSVLSTATWYRVEMKFDATGAGSTDIAEAKIDGTAFASASNLAFPNGVTQVLLGGNLNGEAQTVGDWYFDDVGINKNVGTSQNSYPGDGKIVVAQPNAVGDNSGWTGGSACLTNDYECVDEVTPDDSTTDLLSISAVNTLTDVGMEDSSTLGISANDTIQFVTANVRMSISATATMTLAVRMKDATGGPIIEGNETVGANATWFTNLSSTPRPASITAYTRPMLNTVWTTTALDGLQLGVKEVIDTTSSLQVATMWATVEYSPPTVSVSGNAYNSNTQNALTACDGSTNMISLRAGGTTYTEECADADGAFTFPAVSGLTGGTPMIIWIEGQTPNGATVNQYSSTGNVTGMTVQENSVTIHNDHGLSVPGNDDLDTYDNGNDDDINYTVTSSNLEIEDGHRLVVKTNENFTPGGTITTSPSASQSSMDGDIYLETGATLGMSTNALSIGGDFTTAGTVSITLGSGQTTTFTGTTTGFAIEAEDAFQNLVFNGSGGGWDFDQDATVSGDITMTAGTLSGTDNIAINGGDFSGTSGDINMSGGTVTLSGTGYIGANANWDFSGLTISGDTTTTGSAYFFTNGTLTISGSSELTIDTGDMVWSTSAGTVSITGTLNGGGSLQVSNSSLGTGGTLSVDILFLPPSGTITVPARTYGGDVSIQNDGTAQFSAGTFVFSGNLIIDNGEPAESATLDAATNDPTVTIAGNLDNTIADGSTTLQLGAGTWTVAGNVDLTGITSVTYDTGSTIVMTGTGNLSGSAKTLYNLTINGNGNTVTTTTSATVANTLTIGGAADGDNDTLSIDTGISVTSATTGTVTLVGSGTDSITGAGTLSVKNSNLSTSGTISSIVRFDATNGGVTIPARTYGGAVEAYNNSALTPQTVTIGAGTHNISGSLNLLASNATPITLTGGVTNPTVNITGDLDYTGGGAGTETLVTGNAIWTVGGNVDLTGGSTTVSTGNTLKMNGTSKSLTSAGVILQNFEISGGSTTQVAALDVNGTFAVSSGGFTQAANHNLNIAEDFTLTAGTTFTPSSGSGLLIFDGDLILNDGTSPKQDLGNVHIGTSPDTTDLASDFAAKSLTVNSGDVFNTNGYDVDINTGGISITGTFDATDDVETDETQINCAGSFSINSGATFTADQSTLIMDAGTGTSNLITDGAFSLYNLTIADGGGSLTVEVEDALDVNNNITITGGNLDGTTGEGNAITVGGAWDNDDTYTAQGNTVTFDAPTGTFSIDADGTGTDSFYDLTFNDAAGSAHWDLTGTLDVDRNFALVGGTVDNSAGSYNINIGGGWDNDDDYRRGTETTTFDGTSGTYSIDTDSPLEDDFYNVVINDSAGSTEWDLTSQPMQVDGSLTITDGILDINNFDLYVTGNVNKTGGNLAVNQAGDLVAITGNLTISGNDGSPTFSDGMITIDGNLDISNDNTFDCVATSWPTFRMQGTTNSTISVSGANNDFGNGTEFCAFTLQKTTGYTLQQLTNITGTTFYFANGIWDVNGQTASFSDKVQVDTDGVLKMATGTFTVGRNGTDGDNRAPLSFFAGSSEDITGGTIEIYGTAHATYGTFFADNGSAFTPTGGTVKFLSTDATNTLYILEVTEGDFNFYNLEIGNGTNAKTLNINTAATIPINIDGSLTINGSGTFDTNTEPVKVAGNWTNNGTFTADSGLITLDGSATQTMSGTMTTTSAFYDLTITNSSGSYTGCDTAFTPGVDFSAAATATNNYTITTGNVKVEYNSGSTYTFTNINWAGTAGNEIIFRNSNLTSGTWLLTVTGTQTNVSYVSVGRSDATTGDTIVASNGTNTNCNNNIEWLFSTFSVAGNVYNVNTTTALTECDSSTNMVNLRVQSTTYQTSCNDSTGAYTFSAVATPTTNEAMIIWIEGQTPDGTTVNKYSGSGNVTGIIVEENALTVHNDSAVAVSNTDLDTYDNGDDDDIIYTVTTSNLSVEDTHRVKIKTEENFTPGGTVTTSPSATQTDMDGDIYLEIDATLNMAASALSVGGDFIAVDTYVLTLTAGQNTTFTATAGATYSIDAKNIWQNIVINGGATADWTFNEGATVSGNLTVTSGEINLAGVSVFAGDVTISLDGAFDTVKFMNHNFSVGGSWDNDGDFDGWESIATFNAGSGTETIDGDGIATEKFTNIVFNDGGGGTIWDLTSALTTGNLTITGGTLDANGYGIGVTDNWDNDDTFIHGNNLVNFNGALATFSIDADGTGTDTFFDVTLAGANSAEWDLATDMTVENNFSILTSIFNIGNYTLYVGGNFTNSYQLIENNGHVVMNGGAGTHIIDTSEADTTEYADFYDLAFSDGGAGATYKSYYPLDLDGSLTIPGGSLDMEEAQTYYLTSSTTNAVANNMRIKTVDPAGTANSTSFCYDSSSNQSNLYCMLLPGSASNSWGSAPSTIQQRGYMLSDNQGISGTYAAGNWTVNATATQATGQWSYSGYRLHARLWRASTILGSATAISDWTTYATVPADTTTDVTITFNSIPETTLTNEVLYVEFAAYYRGSALDLGSGGDTTLSLTVNEGGAKQKITTPSFAPQINVAGSWDNDDIFYHTGGTVVFDPISGTKTINSTGATEDDFYNLIINDGVATSTVQLAGTNIQVDNNFTLTEGTYDLNALHTYITGNFSKTGGNIDMNQSTDLFDIAGDFTVSGDGGGSVLTDGVFAIGGNVAISNNNVFQMGNSSGYPVLSMDGAVSKSITVSGTGNYFGMTGASGEVDIDKTGGAVVNVGSDLDIWNLVHNTGGLNIDSNYTVDADGQYVGFGGVLTMTNGTLSVGSDNLAPSSYANFYVASGWTEAISAGTIEVDGAGHATNEAVYFANGSNFTPTGGTFKMIGNDNSTIEVAEVNAVDFNFYDLTIGDGTNTKTVDIDAASATAIDINDILIDTNATFDTNSEPVYVGGNWNNNGTFTADSGAVTFNSGDTTNYIDAGTGSFFDVVFDGIDGSGTWYFQNDNASITRTLDVDTDDIVSINTGINVTWTGASFILDGTIDGLGRLIVDSTTVIPTSGTLSSTVRFDATNGNTSIIPARTYGSTIEPYNSSSVSARTIVLGTAGSQTISVSGWFYPMAEGTQNITLSATDYNPTVNITKSLDFNGAGGGSEIIQSGTGIWSVSGIVDFTDGTYTATTGNTLRMNGPAKTITSAGQPLQNFEINGGGITAVGALDVNGAFTAYSGAFTQATDADMNVAGDFTLSFGTTFVAASGTGKLYLDGDLTLTDNTASKQDLGDLNIGTSPDTTDLATDVLAKGITINSGDVLNSHGYEMTIGVYGLNVIGSMDLTDDVETDETFITTDGDVTFGAASSVTEDQSTITFDAASGTDNIFNPGAQNINNLVINGASLTVEVEDPIVVNNDLTITSGTLDVVSGENNQISLGGDWTNNGTFTAQNGTVVLTGSSTQNMSGTMTTTSQFYNLTISNGSGSYSGCATSFTPGIDFAAAATIGGTYTITTGDAKVEYNSGSAYTATNINWNGGAYGDEIIFRNSNLTSGTWTLDVSGTQTAVKYVDVGRSDASSGDTIDARHISNNDCSNTTNWEFDSITLSISDATIGFGDLTSANARFANGATTGSDSKVVAHTITAYTAADNGYLLTYNGPLLTSGSDTITAATITNDDDGAAGTEQFALGITTAGDCTINTDYNANSPAEYKYVASTTTTLCSETVPTAAEVISTYYIANISSETEAGSYSTDITYIMTATF